MTAWHRGHRTGYAAGAAFLGEDEPRFGENVQRYYEHMRENDLCLTHTLIPPQANRAVNSARQADPYLSARIKEENDAGIVIRGSRMLATLPISDELTVFPSTLLKSPEEVDLAAYEQLMREHEDISRAGGQFAAASLSFFVKGVTNDKFKWETDHLEDRVEMALDDGVVAR